MLFRSVSCKKDKNNNNNNNNDDITDSKYIEFTIDGATYKYEETNGNPVRDAYNDQELPSIVCGSTGFSIGGGTTGGRNSFSLSFPYAISGVGSYTTPTIDYSTTTIPDNVFVGLFVPYQGLVQQYDQEYANRVMNGSTCDTYIKKLTPQTLTITSWEPLGAIPVVINAEGTFSGTLYDNVQGQASCTESAAHPYSGKFVYWKH